jgi:hypothetical protein
MKYAKDAALPQEKAGNLTARTFVRAAYFSTLLVGGVVSSSFLSIAFAFRDVAGLVVGLVLVLLMTLAIWMIAGVLGTVLLVPRWLWAKSREVVVRMPCSNGERSGVWDDWLDMPGRA